MLTVRAMRVDDLGMIENWLGEPHVARWYLAGSTSADEVADLRRSIAGVQPTRALVVLERTGPIGWCQWYRCMDYPEHARAVGAEPGEVGIDYAIGEPRCTGRGLGTGLIGALVAHVREHHPGAGFIVDPDAANVASRRVLEKNGFRLLGERPVASEPSQTPVAIYRLAPHRG